MKIDKIPPDRLAQAKFRWLWEMRRNHFHSHSLSLKARVNLSERPRLNLMGLCPYSLKFYAAPHFHSIAVLITHLEKENDRIQVAGNLEQKLQLFLPLNWYGHTTAVHLILNRRYESWLEFYKPSAVSTEQQRCMYNVCIWICFAGKEKVEKVNFWISGFSSLGVGKSERLDWSKPQSCLCRYFFPLHQVYHIILWKTLQSNPHVANHREIYKVSLKPPTRPQSICSNGKLPRSIVPSMFSTTWNLEYDTKALTDRALCSPDTYQPASPPSWALRLERVFILPFGM